MELYNPFLRKSNSFPRIRQSVLLGCKPFSQIAGCFNRGQKNGFEIEGTNCNPRKQIVKFEGTQSARTSCLKRGKELLIRGNDLIIRENGLHISI